MKSFRRPIALIGTGYVSDLYMRSLKNHPDIYCFGAFDIRSERLSQFGNYWNVPIFNSAHELLASLPKEGVVLNLTNPSSHFEVTRECLLAERHVYSEKPLALSIDEARQLVLTAQERGLHLAAAPCSYLSVTAQTLAAAVRHRLCGTPRLVYAELDDGFIPQAPYLKWFSESGAPWPYEDEFRSGCTVEHAGYYLTWLIAMFGSIRSITAASAMTVEKKLAQRCETPDVAIGTLFFESGPLVRLTCSIVAPHDHRIRVVGDRGVIEVVEAWNNTAPVRYRQRMTVRRRLFESPISRKVRLRSTSDVGKLKWRGAAKMDFLLGPAQMLDEIGGTMPRLCTPELALHVTEATLVMQNAGSHGGSHDMQSRCDALPPMSWAQAVR